MASLSPASGELFWTDEGEEIAVEDPWEGENKFPEVPFAETPKAKDYLRALATGVAPSPEKERHVRIRLWWLSNDRVRRGKARTPAVSAHRKNLLALLALFDKSDPDQRLMAAEACRELGEFGQAARLLEFHFQEGYSNAVNLIKTPAGQQKTNVCQITS